ncbi:hypothetical protein HYPSUDRAFT_216112 [Hypholoma sublateritium FD-334 SS-4]|uniref:Thioester reductase (TE) domain-containing protein n=1 Tax=Hypholoma sublateritium (strain FD-334 SS-4) TaxID=945553 RepID=A0A0D2NSF5_HYPSF|nr:hypothetical protein HYPSUDRAFT_216112 [Hypholoma sublateritium FD-334 SS-4]
MLPSPDSILEHLKRSQSNCMMAIPALLQIWAQDPKVVALLASIEFVAYSGGAVPTKLGNFMADVGVYITPVYGATEFDVSVHWSSQGDGVMADLWIQHPTKPVGRKDDVIVHTSGEKTVPAPMENILLSHPHCVVTHPTRRHADAFLQYHGRDRAGVLVELKPAHAVDTADPAAFATARDALLSAVAEADAAAPAFSRIFKETILIAARGKPLPRAGKGTVMRKTALTAYADVEDPAKVEVSSGRVFDTSDDLFDQGMVSLSATILLRRIIDALQSKNAIRAMRFTQAVVYDKPSISKLAVFLAGVVTYAQTSASWKNTKTNAVEAMITKYSPGLSVPLTTGMIPEPSSDETVVLLTGSTGSLGTQIFEPLLKDTRTVRLVFLDGNAALEKLGVQDGACDEVRHTVTSVIHNAWRVDFNFALAFFEGNVRGTRNLMDLARAADHAHALRFLFSSSISSAFSWDMSRGARPDAVLEDARHVVGTGYGESKSVERILAQSGLQATSRRGESDRTISSASPELICAFLCPADEGRLLVADGRRSADVARRRLSARTARGAERRAPASRRMERHVCGRQQPRTRRGPGGSEATPLVPFRTWVTRLEEAAADATSETLVDIPAIKLLDFFRCAADTGVDATEEAEAGGLPAFETSKAQDVSETLRLLLSIGTEDARRWVRYWKSNLNGFIRLPC